MARITRRDYLKGIGMSAAAIAASQLEVFAQGQRRRILPHEIRQGEEVEIETIDPFTENFNSWPETMITPVNPPILITFDGLIDFYYNRGGSHPETCGVGFQRADGHHRPTVKVLENGQTWWAERQIDNGSEVILKVVKRTGQRSPDAKFLKDKSPKDFRWTLDMQSRPWYPNTQTRGNYAATMYIENGTFFTLSHTKFDLDQVLKIETLGVAYLRTAALGKPAQIVANGISLAADEHVLLKVNGVEKRLLNNGKKYTVQFKNICNMAGPCTFDYQHFQESKRNDFHHHRDPLALPAFSGKYSVVLAPGQPVQIDSNDAAPCMGAGYGGGNGPS